MRKKVVLILIAELLFMYSFCKEIGKTYNNKGNKKNQVAESRDISGSKLNRGNVAYSDLNFSLAATYYESYLKENTKEATAIINKTLSKLADCYWQMRDYPNALKAYLQLYKKGKKQVPQLDKFRIGELYARQGNYEKATYWLEGLQSYAPKTSSYKEKNKLSMMMEDSSNWKVNLLNFNTEFREFCPFVVDSLLLFSSNRPLTGVKQASGWDGESYVHLWQIPIYSLQIVNDSILQSFKQQKEVAKTKKTKQLSGVYEGSDAKIPEATIGSFLNKQYTDGNTNFMGKLVAGLDNQQYNTGPVSVDNDGRVYFSSNYTKPDKKGVVRIKLMTGDYSIDGSIGNIHPFPFAADKSDYSLMHPAINAEGTILVFSSDKGGFGGYDLYVTQHTNNKEPWRKPRLLGPQVNSSGNEVFPSITSDGYLYFSTDGRPGFGGLDIYRISLQDALNGTGSPEHLPYPINSSGDDFGWTQESSAVQAYFTSDRVTSEDNIYRVKYDVEMAKKQEIEKQKSIFQGFVMDRQTMEPLKNVTVFVLNKCNGNVYVAKTTEKGSYTFPLIGNCEVIVRAIGPQFSTDCSTMKENKTSEGENTSQTTQDLLIDKYPENYKWKLQNIYYDFNKWNLRSDAYPVLDSLTTILRSYPLKVELSSHTDSRGSYQYNNWLSQKRAQSAVNYILSKGVDKNRIIAKGYGKTQLINRCKEGVPCSEAEHQANRRTEVKVLVSPTKEKVVHNFDPSKFQDGQVVDTTQLPGWFFKKDAPRINDSKTDIKYESEKKLTKVNQPEIPVEIRKNQILSEKSAPGTFSIQILAMNGTLQNAVLLRKLHNVRVVTCADGYIRYLVGSFNTEEEATAACNQIHKLGRAYRQAFVVNVQKIIIIKSLWKRW